MSRRTFLREALSYRECPLVWFEKFHKTYDNIIINDLITFTGSKVIRINSRNTKGLVIMNAASLFCQLKTIIVIVEEVYDDISVVSIAATYYNVRH